MKVIILRAGSGAGKDHWIKQHYYSPKVFSTDLKFMAEGVYRFDAAKLGEYHAACLREFIEHVRTTTHGNDSTVIVNNTNTSVAEFAPYAQTAMVYGHDVNIFTFLYDPIVAHQRNEHGTPLKACIEMHKRLTEQTQFIPPWWKHDYIVSDTYNTKPAPPSV